MNHGAGKLPSGRDLVVGNTRYGMLLANIISLKLNLPHTSVEAFLRNEELPESASAGSSLGRCWDARHILIVDDVYRQTSPIGAAAAKVRELYSGKVITLV